MSTSVSTSFIADYVAEFKHVFQKKGSILRPTVRRKDGVIGSTTTFQKIGTGVATTKARHGTITPMNQTHTAPSATLVDFYAGDWVDKLDEAKTNIDERRAIAEGGAMALGRKVDDQLITVMNGTTQTTVTWTLTNSGTIRAALLNMASALDANDVPNDGNRYGALTPKAFAMAMTVEAFASADYVDASGKRYTDGAPVHSWINWMGIKWTMHTGLPGKGTASANVYVWHRDAIGYASAKSAGNIASNDMVAADITWHGDRAAHFVNHMMSGGGVLIDDLGVIEGSIDDTGTIPAT